MDKISKKDLESLNKLEKQILVESIFSRISEKYDFMNDIMSLGLHRIWKEEFVNLIKFYSNCSLLDLASGSGDLIKLIKKRNNCFCVSYDSNEEMIRQAQKKLRCEKVSFINGRAENIPFKDKSFDIVTVSFGLRNFSNLEESLKEIRRVMKTGRKFYCLEFSEINNVLFKKIFNFYSKILPFYGDFFLNNKEAYQYLVESIRQFPNQIEFTKKLIKAGFANIEVIDILGGLASIHISET